LQYQLPSPHLHNLILYYIGIAGRTLSLLLFEVSGHFAIDSIGTESGIWKHAACDEIRTHKVFDLWVYLPTLLISLQLFLLKCSFRHPIFQATSCCTNYLPSPISSNGVM